MCTTQTPAIGNRIRVGWSSTELTEKFNQSLSSATWIVSPLQEVVLTYTVGMVPYQALSYTYICSVSMSLLKMIIPFLSWPTESLNHKSSPNCVRGTSQKQLALCGGGGLRWCTRIKQSSLRFSAECMHRRHCLSMEQFNLYRPHCNYPSSNHRGPASLMRQCVWSL